MFGKFLKPIGSLAKFGHNKAKFWMSRIIPLLILFSYLEDAVEAMLHLRLGANLMVIAMHSWQIIGVIYMLLDIGIILAGSVLIASSWHDVSGILMLLLHRTMQSFAFSIWDYELLLQYSVDVACLLLLLAMRLSQRQAFEWHNKQQHNFQRLLLLGRIGICCVFLLWMYEKHQIINKPFAATCFMFMLLGIFSKYISYLTALTLLWKGCFLTNENFFFGWTDSTISVQFISLMLSRVAGLLILGRLGGGKWSLDALF